MDARLPSASPEIVGEPTERTADGPASMSRAQAEAARRVSGILAQTVAAATGHAERDDVVRAGGGGPAGNALLTAWLGVVLLALFAAELLTLIDVRGLIAWHVAIGAVLIPAALAKTGSTGWRILGYYRGRLDYRRAGPPPLLLRVLGPVVVVGTVAVLATGVVLVLLGERASRDVLLTLLVFRVSWITLHQGTFLIWATATGLHLLGRFVPAVRLVGNQTFRGRRVPGRYFRVGLLSVAAATSVLAALLLVRDLGSWADWASFHHFGRGGRFR